MHLPLVEYGGLWEGTVDTVMNYWLPELKSYCPYTPIILVGTKVDLREDETTLGLLQSKGQEPVTNAQVYYCSLY